MTHATAISTKMKIHRGDTVRILRGKDRGKTATILAVIPATRRVLVEGVNMVKKHVRPKRAGEKGQRVTVAAPMHVANVQLVCPACKKGTRIAMKYTDGKRERACKKCGEIIPTKK